MSEEMNEVQEVTEDMEQMSEPKLSKIELKRQQIYMDRLKRHMNQGLTAEQASLAIAREDYERLPVPEKIKRLEKLLAENIRGMVGDLNIIRQNQENLANTMEVNFRGFSKMLSKLGLSEEIQKECMDEAESEFMQEVAALQGGATEETTEANLTDTVDKSGEPEEPVEATTFGG